MASNPLTGDKILDNMVAFIRQHGEEEVARIMRSMDEQFTVQKNAFVDNEKQKISDSFKNELANREVKMKIEKSKEQNERRIEKMRKVNDYIDQLTDATRTQIRESFAADEDSYKQLLKDLLLQGLIKLMESTVVIRCREQDVPLIEDVMDDAISEYKQMIVDQVKMFKDKSPDDIPCNLSIDTTQYLTTIDDDEAGSIGGFKMLAKRGKIVLS